MNKIGIPAHLTALLENLYDSQSSSIRTPASETEYFCNGKGVRQGCILSPHLFNIYTEIIMRLAITEEHSVKIGGKTISNLKYADDTALLATTENELQIILNSVMQISDDFGLLMNVKKTKVMVISKTEIRANILINNEKIEQVSSFTYLGADLNQQNDHSNGIRR